MCGKVLKSNVALGEGSSDNYAYLVTDDKTKDSVIIDPASPDEYDGNFSSTKIISL